MTRITGRISGKSVRRRKPTLLLVARLEQDLTRAQEAIADRNKCLEQIRGDLIQVIDERNTLKWRIAECRAKEDQLRQGLEDIQLDYAGLEEANRKNVDRAYRNGDVAAVLACIIAAAANTSVIDMMIKFTEVAEQMRVSVGINDARDAFKRGYAARIDQVVDDTVACQTKTSTTV